MKGLKEIRKELEKVLTYKTADTINHEEFLAWSMPLYKEFKMVLYLNTATNTFYVDAPRLLKASVEIIEKGVNELPVDYLKEVIVKARQEGFMRLNPIIALVLLRKRDVKAFKEIFNDVVITGNDLKDFLDLNRRTFELGLGRAVKNAIIKWLKTRLNEFYAIKYKLYIKDAIRLARPNPIINPLIDYVATSFTDITKNKLKKIFNNYPQVKAFEMTKIALNNKEFDLAKELIRKYKIPASNLLSILPSNAPLDLWFYVVKNMGLMQILKLLNMFIQNGLIFNKEFTQWLKNVITPKNLRKAKILPLRLIIAYLHLNVPTKIKYIPEYIKNNLDVYRLDELISKYVKDIEDHLKNTMLKYAELYDWDCWNGTWLIAPDVSNSMITPIPGKMYTPAHISAFFTITLKEGLKDKALIYAWDDNLYDYTNLPLLDLFKKLFYVNGGGTFMELPIKELIKNKIKINNIIIITDQEEWGEGFLVYWKQYKRFNPKAKVFMLKVAPYNTQPYSEEAAVKYDIYDIYGWSDAVLDYITYILREGK